MSILEKLKIKIRGTIDIEKLKKDGCIIGKNFNAMQGVIVDPGHCWLIEIGDNVTLAPNVHILAHDASTKIFLNYTKIASTTIGNNVFIGANTVVLPGTMIPDNVIIGAGSVVIGTLESNSIYAGNPVKKICTLEEFLEKHKTNRDNKPYFDEKYIINNITSIRKEEMKTKLKDDIGYII